MDSFILQVFIKCLLCTHCQQKSSNLDPSRCPAPAYGCPHCLLHTARSEPDPLGGLWPASSGVRGSGQLAAEAGVSISEPFLVRAQAKVCHYRVSMAADGSLYLQKGRLFPGLEELLTYYKANWKLIQNPLLQPCVRQVGLCLPSCPTLA